MGDSRVRKAAAWECAPSAVPARVRVVEVGPRDGLQNEPETVATADKIRFVDLLSEAGFEEVEVSSFVSPKRVPQLADAAEVFAGICRRPGTRYTALVPNARGLERALAAGVRSIALFTAASETFTQRNIGVTIDQSLDTFRTMMPAARAHGLRVRAYVSTAFHCPYEGRISAEKVIPVVAALSEMGVDEISLGDTIGHAVPTEVAELLEAVELEFGSRESEVERASGRVGERTKEGEGPSTSAGMTQRPKDPQTLSPTLACHFHDTRGTALANVLMALKCGISVFDSSAGGLGGCPFAPGAAGNLATEDLVYMLHGMGIETGVSLAAVVSASRFLESVLHPLLSGKYLQACG